MFISSDFESDYDSDYDYYPEPIIVRKPTIPSTAKKYSKDEIPPWLKPEVENTVDNVKDKLDSQTEDTVTDTEVTTKESSVEPVDESDNEIISYFINEGEYPNAYDEIIELKKNKIGPRFFLDICNILCGARCESLISVFADSEITFKDFLTISEKELEDLGVLPFQRKLLVDSLYKMHKQPYHPSSLHVVPLDESYSNEDVAKQVLTSVKQMTAMQTTLIYLRKNYSMKDLTKADRVEIANHVKEIRKRILLCNRALEGLRIKAVQWDKTCQPVDLITKHSKRRFRWTPNRIILAVICVTVSYKLWKSFK